MAERQPATVFVRGAGGGIFEMDVPTDGMAKDRWDQAFSKGDLSIVDEAHWVDRADGSAYLVAGPAPKPASKPAKAVGDPVEG